MTKPSRELIKELSVIFEKDSKDHNTFVITSFDAYYKINGIKVKVDKFVSTINKNISCSKLLIDFNEFYSEETPKQYEHAMYFLNRWYSENIMGDKISDFLSQLVITEGKNEWIVTWIGHGRLSRDLLKLHFRSETKDQIGYLMEVYDNWFSNEIIDFCERREKNKKLLGYMK